MRLRNSTTSSASRTVVAATFALLIIPPIRHCNLVLLIDVAAPHALSIDTRICPPTKGASQSRLLTFRPSLLEILLFCWAPASGRFKLRRIPDSIRFTLDGSDVVLGIEEPFGVGCHEIVSQAIFIFVSIREVVERGMDEDSTRFLRGRIE